VSQIMRKSDRICLGLRLTKLERFAFRQPSLPGAAASMRGGAAASRRGGAAASMRGGAAREFHVSRASRTRFQFNQALYSVSGNVILADYQAVRIFARKNN
jgi:hypothetical protein